MHAPMPAEKKSMPLYPAELKAKSVIDKERRWCRNKTTILPLVFHLDPLSSFSVCPAFLPSGGCFKWGFKYATE